MTLYPVAEKFVSINGEGTRAGELAVFIRFRKCNLRCSYCDTKWANSCDAPAEMMSAEEISAYIDDSGVTNVTLTGGEPLLRSGLYELIEILMKNGKSIEIETNGSLPIKKLAGKPCRPLFTMDYKLPSSGMESSMCLENFQYLSESDTVKFVSGSISDLEKAKEIIERFSLSERCHVYFSPVFGSINPEQIVDFMKKYRLNRTRLQLQLHKFIWTPDKKGV
ncbi:MAG: putative 7-carboxy-7-deazaguanine synthase QueE [Ruminococcus sp.]|nr:putative 7-carboxy-7-deazaguanine synthase QueE [Ruminococcus sp.]